MFIDTHCHIDIEHASKYVNDALNSNVNYMFSASENLVTSEENVFLSNKFSSVFACIGVHPQYASKFNYSEVVRFKELLNNKKVVAIGEIGLDYYYSKDNKDDQIKLFKTFLDLANYYNMPVIIHSREATKDTIEVLKMYNLKGIIHCFSGSLEIAKEYIKMGYLLGIGGVLTFKNSKLYEVINNIFLENIVLETDAPYLTPEPFRKYKNESKYIPVIASKIAGIKGVSIDEVMRITTSNVYRYFDKLY